jgi:hypothetical protein
MPASQLEPPSASGAPLFVNSACSRCVDDAQRCSAWVQIIVARQRACCSGLIVWSTVSRNSVTWRPSASRFCRSCRDAWLACTRGVAGCLHVDWTWDRVLLLPQCPCSHYQDDSTGAVPQPNMYMLWHELNVCILQPQLELPQTWWSGGSACAAQAKSSSTLSKPMALLMSSVADGIPATSSCMTCSAMHEAISGSCATCKRASGQPQRLHSCATLVSLHWPAQSATARWAQGRAAAAAHSSTNAGGVVRQWSRVEEPAPPVAVP